VTPNKNDELADDSKREGESLHCPELYKGHRQELEDEEYDEYY